MQVAEIHVSYVPGINNNDQFQLGTSKDTFEIFRAHWNKETIALKEEFKLLLLNRANRVLGIHTLSSGGMNYTVVDPKLVFVVALKTAASGIILCHNHPSGNLTPSARDKEITIRLKEGGKLLGIEVLDHVIISSDGYLSFADEGLL